MLARKQSLKQQQSLLADYASVDAMPTQGASNSQSATTTATTPTAAATTSTTTTTANNGADLLATHLQLHELPTSSSMGVTGAASILNRASVRHFMRLCSVASLISVCANTSRTFDWLPTLMIVTFIVDIVTGTVFTLEMAFKVFSRGLVSGANPYAKDRWCQFDAAMVLFIWISVILQICEMFHLVGPYSVLSVLRSPRPLILIRFIRVFFKFSMPKSRIKQIFKRSSQQIYNVTLFFLFFMSLFGLLGVQLFGQIEKHCVTKGTRANNISILSLAIPDTHCSDNPNYGHQCPDGMDCLELHLDKEIVGYNGFDHIGHSLYVVYQTSSQEGWSHLMYSTFDHYPGWKVAAYFVSVIFFLGLMVRNVFIAVFTETFNEIRVQFQQMWGERQALASESVPKVLRGDDRGWKLVELDESQSQTRFMPPYAKHILNSAAFQVIILLAILLNVFLNASIRFKHDGRKREEFYNHIYWWEVGFTIFFNIEALFKIACLGFSTYWTRTSHRFELLLAIGCSIHIVPAFFMTELADFSVLRVVRLIKASPVLEDFAYKSFGPGRKLGSLIIFTFCLLVVTSTMTMQLFCSLPDYHRFQDFPYAFMSMFQILTQEAWTDVMNETMLRVRDPLGPYISIYFIMYHLFVSLIVLSLFVAVILDNLELPEDIKKAKQLKAREQTACISEELPLRLRIFERFPDSPQMTRLHKSVSDFNVPKVRESFMRSFVDDVDNQSFIKQCLRARLLLQSNNAAQLKSISTTNTNNATSTSTSTSTTTTTTTNTRSSTRVKNLLAVKPSNSSASTNNTPSRLQLSSRCNAIQQLQLSSAQVPSIKLLSTPSKSLSGSKILRKTTIHQLIHDSNSQRLSLMNQAGVSSGLVGGGGFRAQQSQQPLFISGVVGNDRNANSSSLTAKVQQSTYDYLREPGGEGMQENLTSTHPYDLTIKMLKRKRQQAELKRSQREKDLRENHPLFDTPLFVVGRESKFRKFCQLLACSRYQYTDRDPITGKPRKSKSTLHNLLGLVTYLDWLMILVTALSCVSMMFETPFERVMNTPRLQIAEYAFVACMSIELTLKTLANGLVFTPKALLSTPAGIMDSFIFVTSLIYALWMPQEVEPQSLAQCFMLLRCIRPLRIFSLVPHMRQVIYESVRGFKAIFLICVLLFLLCFVFACYGVHVFGGRLARCTDPTKKERANCTGTFLRKVFVTKMRLPVDSDSYPAVLVPRVWANPRRFSFDDILSAMLALFEVLSYKGWVDIREALLKRFDSSLHTLYIHIFVFFGCMVGVTLFVGVVIANYGENKGTALLTVDQRRWCDLKKRLKIAQPLHLPPRPDHIKFRAIIYDITQHIYFKRLIAILVLVNSSLLIVHWDVELLEKRVVSATDISAVFTLTFSIEVIMKMIAFTPRGYWQGRRNRYDLCVTFIGCVWAAMHFAFTTNSIIVTFGFIVVVLRFFTITGKHATLQMLMLTVVVSVYKSFFIILGLFILVFFYSLMGVQLFGSVKFGENLSRQANFRSAGIGTLTMFRIVTGEDWYRMMHDCMIQPPYCTRGKNYWETDCGNFGVSFAFFSSFYIIITHMVLNLLVAIIMENFSLFYSSEEDALLSYTDIRNFQNTWNMVDAQQRGTIPVSRVKFILRLLKGRLEVDLNKDRLLFKHMCHEMERLHNGDDVSFHDVLSMLSYRSVDIRKSLQFEELLAREELEYLIEEEVAKKTIRQWLDKCLRRVRQQRQQSSLIQGLRLTNLGTADLFLNNGASGTCGSASATSGGQNSTAAATAANAGLSTGGVNSAQSGEQAMSGNQQSATGTNQTQPLTMVGQSSTDYSIGRLASSSTSDSQHSITSAITIAQSISKFKRRAEASRSDSISVAAGGGIGSGAGVGVGLGQRKLLTSNSDAKKDERSVQQLKRAIKALTSGSSSGPKLSFAATSKEHQSNSGNLSDLEESNKTKQLRPKLNAAIKDIHLWWDGQLAMDNEQNDYY